MFYRFFALVMVLSFALSGVAVAVAQSATPVPVASPDGAHKVTGTLTVNNVLMAPLYPNPTVAILDASQQVPITTDAFVDKQVQYLGVATSPLFGETPGTFEVDLPAIPQAAPFDITGGDHGSAGLKVFMMQIGSNIFSDSYLQQMEQSALVSFDSDTFTGWFTDGSLIVFAADDTQKFPQGAGADGRWFTVDDDLFTLEPGYTIVHLAEDGSSTTDRSPVSTIDVVEPASEASPDFSAMPWVDAFDALLTYLETHYAFNDFEHIDYDALRSEYGPQIQKAQDTKDLGLYVGALYEMGFAFHDAHVTADPTSEAALDALATYLTPAYEQFGADIGAIGMLVSDDQQPNAELSTTYQIFAVGDSGPAHDAGWKPGTTIVSVDGDTIDERLAKIPAFLFGSGIGTPEKTRLLQSQGMLLFPSGHKATIEYRLPGETETRTAEMTAGAYPLGIAQAPAPLTPAPLVSSTYADLDGYTVIKWANFSANIPERIAVLEAALAHHESLTDGKGIILDMRGNPGGWEPLYLTMASYFYSDVNPLPVHLFDDWEFDPATGTHLPMFIADQYLTAPKPELAYSGPLTVLVDQSCGSSCEFFTQTLQVTKRAQVFGQYGTAGAGGNINQAVMPDGVNFQYTMGRTTFAGTDELSIQGKGVDVDVRVPVTVESTIEKTSGHDVLLEYTVAYLDRELAAASATPVVAAGPSTPAAAGDPSASPVVEATPAS